MSLTKLAKKPMRKSTEISADKSMEPANAFIKEVFGDFCLATGRLPVSRVAEVLQVLGCSPLQSEVDNWTSKYRKKGLEYRDLVAVYETCQHQVHHHTEEEVAESLAVFDVDGNGFIPVSQLLYLMCQPQEAESKEAMKPEEVLKLLETRPPPSGWSGLAGAARPR